MGELSASQEDYLEAILRIRQEKGEVHAKEIADRLQVTRPSVTGALQTLGGEGMVHYAPYDVVTLSQKGVRVAEDVVRRHEALRELFVRILEVPPDEASRAACAMEHALSPDILKRLIGFLKQSRKEGMDAQGEAHSAGRA